MVKESRAEKMYKSSPSLKRGEDGKMGVDRPAAKNAGKETGDGIQDEKAVQDLEHKHAKERMDLYHKHEGEHLDLMQKHMKSGAGKKEDMKEGAMGGEKAEKKGEADKGEKKEDLKEGAMGGKK